jgi:hypothetical protein
MATATAEAELPTRNKDSANGKTIRTALLDAPHPSAAVTIAGKQATDDWVVKAKA